MANKDQNNKNDNNFFNKNPLITFAIFSVVIIMVFKLFVGDTDPLNGTVTGNSRVQQVNYSELKSLVASKSLTKVEIGQTYIKAIGTDGKVYTTRIVKGDSKLVEDLDKQGIQYNGFSDELVH